jgi:hypothetical protein
MAISAEGRVTVFMLRMNDKDRVEQRLSSCDSRKRDAR